MKDLVYQLALTRIPQIGAVQTRLLLQEFENAEAVFKARKSQLERLEGIGSLRAGNIKSFTSFSLIEKEIEYLESKGIRILFITHPDYPQRLKHCYDAPPVLFQAGNTNLNAERVVAVIGTRSHTGYGKTLTENLIQELAGTPILIVSGLAFGIDAIAHQAALKNQLDTVGVLAHGLDQMYPPEHRHLALDMVEKGGGLISEFRWGIKPDKHNFPTRNRIVAGMADATIVVETGKKGGSLITAELANSYNRDVFAFPGRTQDPQSAGCLELIRQNKAALITRTSDLLEAMGWTEPTKKGTVRQAFLIHDLSQAEQTIIQLLQESRILPVDEIQHKSQLTSSQLASTLLQLEMNNLITQKPGKNYSLAG